MKKYIQDFLYRGAVTMGIGPLVFTALYMVLHKCAGINTLTVDQLCRGIISLSALSFVAGGLNALYQVERLPLMVAIFIHGAALYFGYLGTYLINDWLEYGKHPIIIFTVIFIAGYITIWGVIYSITKKNTAKLNEKLRQRK